MNVTAMVQLGLLVFLAAAFLYLIWRVAQPPAPDHSAILAALDQLATRQQESERRLADELARVRLENTSQQQLAKTSLEQRFDALRDDAARRTDELTRSVTASFQVFTNDLDGKQSRFHGLVDDKLSRQREESATSLKEFEDSLLQRLAEMTQFQKAELAEMRATVDTRLARIQEDNEKKLEQMRQTVEEKLQGTLESRLGESFKVVSDRLEQVYKGLGEMQALAAGVGDLKRVLTNVKTRGTWGEVQLGSLLEQLLAPHQYEANVAVTGGLERVEFAIKLPGRDLPVWLPIDAKFPLEDYQRLVDASDRGDAEAVDRALRQLESTLKLCAKNISQKYLEPPKTTDFGILFLSTEGLYAEAMRRPALSELIQREYRVILAGPSTLAALLNSLQMGFRTLEIQKRSSEVWELLGQVKTEFTKYSEVLAKVRKQLSNAQNTIDEAETRTRVIQRRLRKVEGAGDPQMPLLDVPAQARPEEDEEDFPLFH
jgi:DNA recombination protein RmuC